MRNAGCESVGVFLRPGEPGFPAHLNCRCDEEVMQALVMAGVMVVLADGFVA
jgi:hypothetical protein